MQSLKDRKKNEKKKVLLIGDSGSGKTSLLGTVAGLWIADFDNGLDVLAGNPNVQYDEYFDNETKPTAWKRFRDQIEAWRKAFPEDIKAISVDSITTAAETALRHVVYKNGHTSSSITQQDWGQAINEVKDMLAWLTTLPCHVIVTAHYQMVRDDAVGQTFFVPMVYGKELPQLMPKFFNDCWRTFVDIPIGVAEPKYQMQVRPSGRYNTLKNTLGVKESYVEPNFEKLIGATK